MTTLHVEANANHSNYPRWSKPIDLLKSTRMTDVTAWTLSHVTGRTKLLQTFRFLPKSTCLYRLMERETEMAKERVP